MPSVDEDWTTAAALSLVRKKVKIMKHPQQAIKALITSTIAFSLLLTILIFPTNSFGQAMPNPVPANEPIATGSYVIAMDNNYQGRGIEGSNCMNDWFNLRAYGLAVRLLHNNIPVKWAISATKSDKDGVDFTAQVTRQYGRSTNCGDINGGNYSFRGGPLVIPVEYTGLADPVIAQFNSEIGDSRDWVRVYRTTAPTTAPVRYTLTHKPLVAVGPDGGGHGDGVYQRLFNRAKITSAPNTNAWDYVENDILTPDSCFTIAAQAHAADNAVNYIQTYRNFAMNGGNLLLQCKSVETFENHLGFGLFQTTNGWTNIFTTNTNGSDVDTPLVFPNPAMPFNQFVGDLDNEPGYVTEYSVGATSSIRPGTLIAARNSFLTGPYRDYSNRNVATVSRIGSSQAGGHVFELGGHAYAYDGSTFENQLDGINGARMALNTLLVPATRPGCSLAQPQVLGFKHVRLVTDVNGNGFINQGDTVEWTINYINTSSQPAINFQIEDVLQTGVVITATGAQTVTPVGPGTSAAKNPNYNGAGNNNLLAPGATLGAGERITVVIPTTVTASSGQVLNHPLATGSNMQVSGVTTDTIDNGTITGHDVTVPTGSYPQDPWQTGGLDPTGIQILSPSAADASVRGSVRTPSGHGIGRAIITLTDLETGDVRTTTTSSFGRFSFTEVESNRFYIISVSQGRYEFTPSEYSFMVNDDVAGLTFIGTSVGSSGTGVTNSATGVK